MRYRELIDDKGYIRSKNELTAKILHLEQQLKKTKKRAQIWLEQSERTFKYTTYARINFIKDDLQKKREILTTIGSDPILSDKKLHIEARNWLVPIDKNYKPLEAEYLKVRTEKFSTNKTQTNAIASVRAQWLGRRDSNPRVMGPEPIALPLGYSPI